MNTKASSPKQNQATQAQEAFAKLMKNVSIRGFYGTASVTVHVQDGHIQYARVTVDRRVQ